MKEDVSVVELLIPDDEKVLNILKSFRWADGVYCPKCGSKNVVKYGFVRRTSLRRYLCRECEKHFTDLTGTIFSDKRIPIGECFYIITQLDKKSIKRLSEELGHKWETINRLAKDFKESLNQKTHNTLLQGEIEMDEMYIHAGSKGIKKKNHGEER